jgi:flagellar hook-basal body complex protein FliE
MDVRTAFANQTYAQARPATAPEAAAGGSAGSAFASLANNFTTALSNHEATARSAMTGGADPHALVQALASSQLAVETVATVRDKVVEAYQEILRMPV